MLNREAFRQSVRAIPVGKLVGSALYVHIDELVQIADDVLGQLLRTRPTKANVIKLESRKLRMSFLSYPDFVDDHWPALTYSVVADLVKGKLSAHKFSAHNPPILHRKELIYPSHPDAQAWADLTRRCELVGAFRETRTIGTRLGWVRRLKECRASDHDIERWLERQCATLRRLHGPPCNGQELNA